MPSARPTSKRAARNCDRRGCYARRRQCIESDPLYDFLRGNLPEPGPPPQAKRARSTAGGGGASSSSSKAKAAATGEGEAAEGPMAPRLAADYRPLAESDDDYDDE